MQQQWQHLGEEPGKYRVAAGLRQQHTLSPKLETVQSAHVTLAQLLDRRQVILGNRPMPEERVDLLCPG